MKVKLLTTEQKDLLVGIEITNSHFYNPSLDANGDWFISIQECSQTSNPAYAWVKDLPEIDYAPIPLDLSEFNVN